MSRRCRSTSWATCTSAISKDSSTARTGMGTLLASGPINWFSGKPGRSVKGRPSRTTSPGRPGVAHLFVPPTDPVYKLVEAKGLAKYPYDPTRAAHLLANAGWTKGPEGMLRNSAGQGFPFEIRDGADVGVVFADMLKQGG